MKVHNKLKKYLKETRLNNLYKEAKSKFDKSGLISHNWDHIYRDIINAIRIGEVEGADMNIVLPAIILHDIGFLYNPDPSKHHLIGAEKCVEWLEDWIKEDVEKIASCIKCHKGKSKKFNFEPETLEEKVVCDADLLEKYGMIGVLAGLRTFIEFGQTSKPEFKSLYNISKAFSNYEVSSTYTRTASEIARRRGNKLQEVFSKALEELEEYE